MGKENSFKAHRCQKYTDCIEKWCKLKVIRDKRRKVWGKCKENEGMCEENLEKWFTFYKFFNNIFFFFIAAT